MKKILSILLLITYSLTINSYAQLIKKTVIVEKVGYKTFDVSYYCINGKMSNGRNTKSGVVAADIRYYPLGTRLLIGNDIFIVSDTGSAIRGQYRIDIWVSSCRQAIQMGRKKIQGKVL